MNWNSPLKKAILELFNLQILDLFQFYFYVQKLLSTFSFLFLVAEKWYLSRVTKTCKIINFDNYFYYICTWCCTIITTTQNPFNFTAKLFTVLATKIIYFWHNGHLYFGAVFTIDKNSTGNNKILSWGEIPHIYTLLKKKINSQPYWENTVWNVRFKSN